MATYVFRVHLLPNPPLGFEGDAEVWRDVEVDESHTLEAFHEAIFEAFDRVESHGYEFLTQDEDGISTRSYVDPRLYEGAPSWRPMDEESIERFIDQRVPEDVSEGVKDRFRELRSNPPTERNAAETTVGDLDPESLGSLFYEFDPGAGWEHHVEPHETRSGTLDGPPRVVGEQGDAPPQYPDVE